MEYFGQLTHISNESYDKFMIIPGYYKLVNDGLVYYLFTNLLSQLWIFCLGYNSSFNFTLGFLKSYNERNIFKSWDDL